MNVKFKIARCIICKGKHSKIVFVSVLIVYLFINVFNFEMISYVKRVKPKQLKGTYFLNTSRLKEGQTILAFSRLRKKNNFSDYVYLAGVILVRIYKEDKAKWTTVELKQWMDYIFYAGVERIYLYDHFKFPNESLKQWSEKNFPGNIQYHDWSKYFPYSIDGTQMRAYRHALNTYKNLSTWQIAFDMDEFPFVINDKRQGFLQRFLKEKSRSHPKVTEWSIKNFLFLGKAKKDHHILRRYLRRTPSPSNHLDKPIFRTNSIRSKGIHHNTLSLGVSRDADPREIRMNHYWGARLQNWGNDTQEILNKTVFDDSIVEIADRLDKYDTVS